MTKRRGRRRARVCSLSVVLVLGATACSGGEGDRGGSDHDPGGSPAPEFDGRILARTRFGTPEIHVHDLAKETSRLVALPGATGNVFDAWWDESGELAYAFVLGIDGGMFYEIDQQGRARRFGGLVEGASGGDLGGSLLSITACSRGRGRILAMDLEGDRRFREVARGCNGAVSPDGRHIAYSPDGRSVWTVAASGRGEPTKVAELGDLRGVEPGVPGRGRVVGIDWGDGGIALEISIEYRLLAAVVGEDGSIEAASGDPNTNELDLEWQPGGERMAVATYSSAYDDAEAVIRMVDEGAGDSQVVAVDPSRFFNMTWSPGGDYLVASTSGERWVFIDAEGNWLRSEHVIGADTLDWGQ